MNTLQKTVTIAAGRITAPRCQAKAKHSQEQCRERCAAAKTVHGWETRKKRQICAEKFREMKMLFNSVNW